MAISEVLDLVKSNNLVKLCSHGDYTSDGKSLSVMCNVKLTTAVRKYLATSIRDLMEHGATATEAHSIVPLVGCFSKRLHSTYTPVHAWEIVLQYYEIKNGERFNSTPARKLSQSFNLDIGGSSSTSSKQNMLVVIGNIVSMHSAYKRSYDSQFKAFICAGLK